MPDPDYSQQFQDPNIPAFTGPPQGQGPILDYSQMVAQPSAPPVQIGGGLSLPMNANPNMPGFETIAGGSATPIQQGPQIGGGLTLPAAGASPMQPPTPAQPTGLTIGGGMTLPGQPANVPSSAGPVGAWDPNFQAPKPGAAGGATPVHFDQPAAVAPGARQSTWRPSAAPTGGGGGGGANPLLKDLAEQKNILATGNEQAAQARMGESGLQENMGATIEANAADNKARADKELQDQQGHMEELRQQQEVAQNFHVDPNRYMKNQNFLQIGLTGIAAMLNSVSKAYLHQGGPNEVMESLSKNVDRDIALQQQDYEKLRAKGQDAQNLYAMNLKATGSHDDAIRASQIQGLEAQKNYMLASAARTNNVNLDTNAKLAGNAIDQQIDTLKAKQAAAAGAAAAAKAAEQEKQFKEFAQKNVDSGRFRTVDEAQNGAHQLVYGRQQGDTAPAPILVKDPNAGATESADQDLKQAQGLNRVGQEALGSYGASLTLPGSDLRKKDAKAQEYDEGMVAQLEAKGYSARTARAKVEQFTISGHPEAVQKERLAAWQDANQNGLFPRIKKGSGEGTEPGGETQ